MIENKIDTNHNYNKTLQACFTGIAVQAIIINFAPLLFLMIHTSYGIPLEQVTLLITLNFATQLITDFAAIWFIDKIGYRVSAIMAHALCAVGLVLMSFLPEFLPSAFLGFFLL